MFVENISIENILTVILLILTILFYFLFECYKQKTKSLTNKITEYKNNEQKLIDKKYELQEIEEKLEHYRQMLDDEGEELDELAQNLSIKEIEITSGVILQKNVDKAVSVERNKLTIREQELNRKEECLQNIINEHQMQYPWLAQAFADYLYMFDKKKAQLLLSKTRPAEKAAAQVTEIAKEKRELQKLCKLQEYQLNYYESVFPWLEDMKETDIYEVWEATKQTECNDNEEYSVLKKWLSPEEYRTLSRQEKNQLALDRYQKRKKTKWEIGIEFERYIGYLFEQAGEKVTYNGAIKGLEDMGRDLIVESKNKIRIIQCKRWSAEKTIHEKHIFQLYGSMVMMKITDPPKPLEGVFITTAPLSETAQRCANYLHIKVKLMDPQTIPKEYPLIKCNISRKDGQKIYHLPFDQQYDKVIIEPEKGEFFAQTIAEAEAAGFRRAWKHTKVS
jgi:restriction endonuclease Mrr